MAGTIIYALEYVVNEKLVVQLSHVSPEQYCYSIGICSLLFSLLYIFVYTIPNFNVLITERVTSHNGNILYIVSCYLLLIVASFGHSISYFRLLKNVGAVATGILQALRAISVFAFSALLFCSFDASQCYNWYKGLATALVSVGVISFSYFSPPKNKS